MKREHIAICGLNCSSCAAFIATQNNDKRLREKTAKEWTERYKTSERNRSPLKPEDINCKGCLTDGPIYLYCRQCKIRQFGFKKGLKNCEECEEYKCNELTELQSHFF